VCICVLEGRGYVLKVCVWFKEVCMCIEGVCVYDTCVEQVFKVSVCIEGVCRLAPEMKRTCCSHRHTPLQVKHQP
jgi:hypothetical protein